MPPITKRSTRSARNNDNATLRRPRTRSQTPDLAGSTTSRSATSSSAGSVRVNSSASMRERPTRARTLSNEAASSRLKVIKTKYTESDDTSDSTSGERESDDYQENSSSSDSEIVSPEEEEYNDADDSEFEVNNLRRTTAKSRTSNRRKATRKQIPATKSDKARVIKRKKLASSNRTIQRVNQIMPVLPLRQVLSNQDQSKMTPYELARERLHVSAVPNSLPCREDQFLEILGYVEGAIRESTGTCVYISGVPGTGKTATVLEVIRYLQHQAEEKELPAFDFVEINGMKLADPNQSYSILWECMDKTNQEESGGKKKKYTAQHALQMLQSKFANSNEDKRTTVVLMDELDLLVTKKQTVMYNFFDWPSRPLSKLIVVAIANTMDLPERIATNKIASRMGLARINFQPYKFDQLIQIVQSRLEGIDAFAKEAVEFAARKVSAVSGDARRALDICRRAVEIVESRLAAKEKGIPAPDKVTIAIVDEAVREMFSSPSIAFVRSCSLHQKIFLVACMQTFREIGLKEIEFGDVAHHHIEICKWHNLEPPNTSDLMRICESLGQTRAILMEGGRMDIAMRLALNLAEEDVVMACKADKLINRLLESINIGTH